ncbi:14263_t:CDS:2 [Funneliformis geosporum]|nr:14263_t:CDS:2 [Funneliformis geosporum]
MVKKLVNLNAVVHFKGDYIDDNKKLAKERRHLSIEKKDDDLFFMKLTSEKRKELNQIRLKLEPNHVECLNLISYPVFNRKVKISLTELETTNYRYFYVCSLHSDEDKLTPDKKIISIKASELIPTNEIPCDYFKEYNQKPERKNYLSQKAKERYHLLKDKEPKIGMAKFSCPNCKTTYLLQKK